VLLRLAYLGVTSVFALLRLLPSSDRDKDAGILVLRHQIMVLERQLGRFRLLIRPEAVLRWHRDLLARRHAARSRPTSPGRPRTVRSIRQLVLRLARENPCWGYRRIHGELLVPGIKVPASTMREIRRQAGTDPAPERTTATWGGFLRSPAEARSPAASPGPSP
jgi:putative transposase